MKELTSYEQKILNLLSCGLNNDAIAKHLCISEHTVKWHVEIIYDKLCVKNRVQASILGFVHGYVTSDIHS
jgi:DNA-binding NarL/FixJ family response regulator